MAYRFTNTDKWNDSWFSELPQFEKLFFIYLCDNCDIAGFIEINYNRFCSDLNTTKPNILGALEGLSRGLIISESIDCVFIRNFLKHQKNLPLNEKNNAHIGIIKRFELYKHKFNILSIEEFMNQDVKPLLRGYGKGNDKGNGTGKGKKDINFDFKNSLVQLGIDEELVKDFMLVRNKKKSTNTSTAFNRLKNQLEISGLQFNDAIRFSIERSWTTFEYDWYCKAAGIDASKKSEIKQETLFDKQERIMALAEQQYNNGK